MILKILKQVLRKNKTINQIENELLTDDFNAKVFEIKEYNSKVMFDTYYIPKAIELILKEENYLTTEQGAIPRAKALLEEDMKNGVIDEFYRLVEKVN